jgi:hypothetical protein
MSTLDRAIQGEGSQTDGTYNGGSANYTNLNSDDADTSFLSGVSGSLAYTYHCYNMVDFSELGTINGVTVSVKARYVGVSGGVITPYCRISSTNYYGTQSYLTNSYASYTKEWTSNPAGGAWNTTSLNAAEFGFRLQENVTSNSGPCVTYQKITVDYSPYIGFHSATQQRRYKSSTFSTFTFPDPAGGSFSTANDGYYMIAGLVFSGIPSLEAFGAANVGRQTLLPGSIASLEALGTPQLNLILLPSGIASAEAFGTLKILLYLLPSSIASAESVGEPRVVYILSATGIPSAESFGTPQLNFVIFPSSILSAEAFGSMIISKPLLFIQRYTIEIHDSSGNLLAVLKDTYGIVLEEQINAPIRVTFMSRADDDKLSYLTRANEIWVRDVENDTVLVKTRLQRDEDTR